MSATAPAVVRRDDRARSGLFGTASLLLGIASLVIAPGSLFVPTGLPGQASIHGTAAVLGIAAGIAAIVLSVLTLWVLSGSRVAVGGVRATLGLLLGIVGAFGSLVGLVLIFTFDELGPGID